MSSAAGLASASTSDNLGHTEFVRLLDASPAMLWMADHKGSCTFASRAWLEFREHSLEQELGTGWAEGIHPDDSEHTLREYRLAIAAGNPFRLEYRIRSANGHYYQVENCGRRCPETDSQPACYVGCIAVIGRSDDRTRVAAKQLSTLSHRERQILELISQGFATKEAAAKLGISYKTADSHRSHIFKKLGLHETASVVRFAVRSGLIVA